MTSPPRVLLPVVMLAVLGAGCSNATAAQTGTVSSPVTSPREAGVKFAQCMRTNGVRDFPDPDASGTYTIDGIANGSSLDTNSTTFKQAISACKDLQPPGFTGHKRTAEEQANALKFAQCIRDNGVKDFPDPAPDGPLLDVDGSKPGLKAALNAAMQKCRDFAAQAGVVGGR